MQKTPLRKLTVTGSAETPSPPKTPHSATFKKLSVSNPEYLGLDFEKATSSELEGFLKTKLNELTNLEERAKLARKINFHLLLKQLEAKDVQKACEQLTKIDSFEDLNLEKLINRIWHLDEGCKRILLKSEKLCEILLEYADKLKSSKESKDNGKQSFSHWNLISTYGSGPAAVKAAFNGITQAIQQAETLNNEKLNQSAKEPLRNARRLFNQIDLSRLGSHKLEIEYFTKLCDSKIEKWDKPEISKLLYFVNLYMPRINLEQKDNSAVKLIEKNIEWFSQLMTGLCKTRPELENDPVVVRVKAMHIRVKSSLFTETSVKNAVKYVKETVNKELKQLAENVSLTETQKINSLLVVVKHLKTWSEFGAVDSEVLISVKAALTSNTKALSLLPSTFEGVLVLEFLKDQKLLGLLEDLKAFVNAIEKHSQEPNLNQNLDQCVRILFEDESLRHKYFELCRTELKFWKRFGAVQLLGPKKSLLSYVLAKEMLNLDSKDHLLAILESQKDNYSSLDLFNCSLDIFNFAQITPEELFDVCSTLSEKAQAGSSVHVVFLNAGLQHLIDRHPEKIFLKSDLLLKLYREAELPIRGKIAEFCAKRFTEEKITDELANNQQVAAFLVANFAAMTTAKKTPDLHRASTLLSRVTAPEIWNLVKDSGFKWDEISLFNLLTTNLQQEIWRKIVDYPEIFGFNAAFLNKVLENLYLSDESRLSITERTPKNVIKSIFVKQLFLTPGLQKLIAEVNPKVIGKILVEHLLELVKDNVTKLLLLLDVNLKAEVIETIFCDVAFIQSVAKTRPENLILLASAAQPAFLKKMLESNAEEKQNGLTLVKPELRRVLAVIALCFAEANAEQVKKILDKAQLSASDFALLFKEIKGLNLNSDKVSLVIEVIASNNELATKFVAASVEEFDKATFALVLEKILEKNPEWILQVREDRLSGFMTHLNEQTVTRLLAGVDIKLDRARTVIKSHEREKHDFIAKDLQQYPQLKVVLHMLSLMVRDDYVYDNELQLADDIEDYLKGERSPLSEKMCQFVKTFKINNQNVHKFAKLIIQLHHKTQRFSDIIFNLQGEMKDLPEENFTALLERFYRDDGSIKIVLEFVSLLCGQEIAAQLKKTADTLPQLEAKPQSQEDLVGAQQKLLLHALASAELFPEKVSNLVEKASPNLLVQVFPVLLEKNLDKLQAVMKAVVSLAERYHNFRVLPEYIEHDAQSTFYFVLACLNNSTNIPAWKLRVNALAYNFIQKFVSQDFITNEKLTIARVEQFGKTLLIRLEEELSARDIKELADLILVQDKVPNGLNKIFVIGLINKILEKPCHAQHLTQKQFSDLVAVAAKLKFETTLDPKEAKVNVSTEQSANEVFAILLQVKKGIQAVKLTDTTQTALKLAAANLLEYVSILQNDDQMRSRVDLKVLICKDFAQLVVKLGLSFGEQANIKNVILQNAKELSTEFTPAYLTSLIEKLSYEELTVILQVRKSYLVMESKEVKEVEDDFTEINKIRALFFAMLGSEKIASSMLADPGFPKLIQNLQVSPNRYRELYLKTQQWKNSGLAKQILIFALGNWGDSDFVNLQPRDKLRDEKFCWEFIQEVLHSPGFIENAQLGLSNPLLEKVLAPSFNAMKVHERLFNFAENDPQRADKEKTKAAAIKTFKAYFSETAHVRKFLEQMENSSEQYNDKLLAIMLDNGILSYAQVENVCVQEKLPKLRVLLLKHAAANPQLNNIGDDLLNSLVKSIEETFNEETNHRTNDVLGALADQKNLTVELKAKLTEKVFASPRALHAICYVPESKRNAPSARPVLALRKEIVEHALSDKFAPAAFNNGMRGAYFSELKLNTRSDLIDGFQDAMGNTKLSEKVPGQKIKSDAIKAFINGCAESSKYSLEKPRQNERKKIKSKPNYLLLTISFITIGIGFLFYNLWQLVNKKPAPMPETVWKNPNGSVNEVLAQLGGSQSGVAAEPADVAVHRGPLAKQPSTSVVAQPKTPIAEIKEEKGVTPPVQPTPACVH